MIILLLLHVLVRVCLAGHEMPPLAGGCKAQSAPFMLVVHWVDAGCSTRRLLVSALVQHEMSQSAWVGCPLLLLLLL